MKKKREALRILIAGGGTGGHLFPGLAIAKSFLKLHPNADIRFAGSSYGLEARVVPEWGFRLYLIPVRGLYQVSLKRKLWVAAMLPVAFLRSLFLLLSFRPHLVIGVGGYASGPVMATAILMRRVTVIQEQNAYPGLTNRLLGRYVRLSFVPVEGLEQFFPRSVVVGNPVRPDIMALRSELAAERTKTLLLVFGGSQGAHVINQAMMNALPSLARWGGRLEILHQTGETEAEGVAAAYEKAGISHQVVPFIEDMADAFRRCRLVVSRAGASAVAEIIAARRPAILVPIPGTSGDHQLKNARRVEEAGAGVVIEQADLAGETLAESLTGLLDNPDKLKEMEKKCDTLFYGDAAGRIVEECLRLIPS